MGCTSEFNVEQLTINMTQYEFSTLFEWLIDNFGYGSWSLEDFKFYGSRWGWEGTGEDTQMFFKYKDDAVLFKLVWLNA